VRLPSLTGKVHRRKTALTELRGWIGSQSDVFAFSLVLAAGLKFRATTSALKRSALPIAAERILRLPFRQRRRLVTNLVAGAEIGLACLIVLLPLRIVVGTLASTFVLISALYLLWIRKHYPERSCGCTARAAPVGSEALLLTGLLSLMAVASFWKVSPTQLAGASIRVALLLIVETGLVGAIVASPDLPKRAYRRLASFAEELQFRAVGSRRISALFNSLRLADINSKCEFAGDFSTSTWKRTDGWHDRGVAFAEYSKGSNVSLVISAPINRAKQAGRAVLVAEDVGSGSTEVIWTWTSTAAASLTPCDG